MGRIADFFGAPLVQNRLVPQNQNIRLSQIPVERLNNGVPVAQIQQPVVEPQLQESLKGSQSWFKGTKMLIK